MEHREPGYYWVRLGADPVVIAEWSYYRWRSMEWSLTLADSERVVVVSDRLLPPHP